MTTGVRHLKMAELSSRSGIAASTIRHYLRLGLLPEPLRTGTTMAYYGPEHLERLTYIRRRLQAGVTLREVAQELAGQALPSAAAEDGQPVHSSQRARLIRAGSAVFLRSGFEAASVEDVVKRAGVGKAAFYRHFAGKRDLLAACIQQRARLVRDRDEQDSPVAGTADASPGPLRTPPYPRPDQPVRPSQTGSRQSRGRPR